MPSIKDCQSIADLRRAAKRRAHRMVFDYIDGGADDEVTLSRNTTAFERYAIMHKSLVGVEHINTETTLLGQKLAIPFFMSAAAGHRLFHTVGERAAATVAKEFGTAFCLSTLSSVSIEDIAAIGPDPRWFQLYVWKDRGLVKEMIARAREAGYSALILTVDFPITGNRERDFKNGFTIPPKTGIKQAIEALRHPAWTLDYLKGPAVQYANLDEKTSAVSLNQFVGEQLHAGFNWRDAEWMLGEWNGPSAIKGVIHPDDAVQSVKSGFDAVFVSNHGGRQLDTDAAPIDVLPMIADKIAGDAEIVLDGGIRRGTDMIKALALGANAVSFARPYLYGLAAGGTPGVRRAIEIMSEAFRRDMALTGVTSIKDITPDLIFDLHNRR
ncbi:MAG: alpha-hydroxy acid oxidase [Litorimonas sp.]